jgi:hypothetical protein
MAMVAPPVFCLSPRSNLIGEGPGVRFRHEKPGARISAMARLYRYLSTANWQQSLPDAP